MPNYTADNSIYDKRMAHVFLLKKERKRKTVWRLHSQAAVQITLTYLAVIIMILLQKGAAINSFVSVCWEDSCLWHFV